MEQFYTYLFEEHYRVAGRVLRRELKIGGLKWLSSILEERGTIPQKTQETENRVAGAVTRPGSHTTRHAYYAPRRFPAASPSSCHLSVKLIRPISLNQAIFMAICD